MKALIILTAIFLAAVSLNNMLRMNPLKEIERDGVSYDNVTVNCDKDSCSIIGYGGTLRDSIKIKR